MFLTNLHFWPSRSAHGTARPRSRVPRPRSFGHFALREKMPDAILVLDLCCLGALPCVLRSALYCSSLPFALHNRAFLNQTSPLPSSALPETEGLQSGCTASTFPRRLDCHSPPKSNLNSPINSRTAHSSPAKPSTSTLAIPWDERATRPASGSIQLMARNQL